MQEHERLLHVLSLGNIERKTGKNRERESAHTPEREGEKKRGTARETERKTEREREKLREVFERNLEKFF